MRNSSFQHFSTIITAVSDSIEANPGMHTPEGILRMLDFVQQLLPKSIYVVQYAFASVPAVFTVQPKEELEDRNLLKAQIPAPNLKTAIEILVALDNQTKLSVQELNGDEYFVNIRYKSFLSHLGDIGVNFPFNGLPAPFDLENAIGLKLLKRNLTVGTETLFSVEDASIIPRVMWNLHSFLMDAYDRAKTEMPDQPQYKQRAAMERNAVQWFIENHGLHVQRTKATELP